MLMIQSIRHKGLLLYYTEGNGSKLPAAYVRKINRVLNQLDAVTSVEDIQALGSGIHKLTGDRSKFWSIKVTPNYRIIFRFENGDVYDIDFLEYH
ncbi:type II toxin-antitoxin system RelE/ParE family toxin [Telluribacter sp.]|jgi:proteic killer suppression protein|uniref:type II toxin-antitoxin system RelE/ParE family toxin n=1 Tax=Telluribacter sp. TaxID=1978767 RepID=UPI002E104983|nr:type II toxin-antitoxin system RelE/ParE family toxin [Telluribacter sp.]